MTLLGAISYIVHLGHKFSVTSLFHIEIFLFLLFGHLCKAMLLSTMKMNLVYVPVMNRSDELKLIWRSVLNDLRAIGNRKVNTCKYKCYPSVRM